MAIVDVVKWNANEYLYAWKFPSEELSTWTQLIVSETQEAILMKEGQACGPFKAGRYTLDTKNLPVLTSFLKIPMGGKTPFTAEVWFVNKMMTLDVKWGTPDPIQLQDPKYNIMLPVRAFGQCGIQISDSLEFLLKLVGTMPVFDRNQLTSYFRGVVLTRSKDLIAKKIIKDGISILEISAHLTEISTALQDQLKAELAEFGVNLVNFFVNSINTPEDDPAVAKLKEALARKAEMGILGFTYQQQRSFDTLEAAAANPGGGQAGVMGAGMGLGMGLGVGGAMGSSMGQMAQNLQFGGVACPKCGMSNQSVAKFCFSCGATLAQRPEQPKDDRAILVCDKCGTEVSGGTKFCPGCGKRLLQKCTKCDTVLPYGTKFCSECGTVCITEEDNKHA
jgi:membrane protease subunit (stomatin/prohibitin family)